MFKIRCQAAFAPFSLPVERQADLAVVVFISFLAGGDVHVEEAQRDVKLRLAVHLVVHPQMVPELLRQRHLVPASHRDGLGRLRPPVLANVEARANWRAVHLLHGCIELSHGGCKHGEKWT